VADEAGTLDATFGQKGLASGGASQMPTSIAIDASGRTVVAGAETSTGKLFVSRFLPNGAPDPELDGDGTAAVVFDPTLPVSAAMSLALGADGSIVVGGFATINGGKAQACVAKLDAKGSPVAGFGKEGRSCLKTPLLPDFTMINGVASSSQAARPRNAATRTLRSASSSCKNGASSGAMARVNATIA